MSTSTYDEPRAPSATVDTIASVGTHTHRRISWAAIFGGVILIVAIQLLLSLLGAGIGLGTVDTNAGSTPTASSLGLGAGSGGLSAAASLSSPVAMSQRGWRASNSVLTGCCMAS